MRFAFSIALKYLIPRKRHLSVSIISLLSVLVISLVVWLSIVFLSVTHGIEKKWLQELTTLTPPIKVKPTEAYYNSYYYLVDSISQQSNFTLKSIGEKLQKEKSDPYDPTVDAEPPSSFPEPLLESDGSLKDLVKEAKEAILPIHSGLRLGEFEAGFGNLHLTLIRGDTENLLTQVSYIVSHDKENHKFDKLLLEPRKEDLDHLTKMLALTNHKEGLSTFLIAQNTFPKDQGLGEAILLPKGFQKNKVLIGDKGYIAYYTTTGTGMQEQRLPIYVSGFYDPGMMPLGNKMLFADPSVSSTLKGNVVVTDEFFGNGFSVWLDNIEEIGQLKQEIVKNLEKKELSSFFSVEAFTDYDFSRPLLEQLKSDKNLFTLIALIILLVACSNVISMLLILVNDKKKEVAVLQSMGATRSMIVTIFGLAGMVTGALSCLFGALAAFFTLRYLDLLLKGLSFLQGREAFQSAFYGNLLPNTLSLESVVLIIGATCIVSFLAGVVPALKAVNISPSQTLRGE